MEKEIGKIKKNDTSDIIIRVDDFGGKRGLTIREFVSSERYTGFTKAGVRIQAGDFAKFKEMINSVNEDEINAPADESAAPAKAKAAKPQKKLEEDMPDY